MAGKRSGRCACGAVTYEYNFTPTFIAICHCLDYKKASGGEAATFFAVPEENFTLLSGDPKPFHCVAQSGNKLERLYCPNCGARVYTGNLEGIPKTVFVQLASLDDPTGIEPKLEMFTKRRLDWARPLDLPQFPDMPH
jgi:hypothetical protein